MTSTLDRTPPPVAVGEGEHGQPLAWRAGKRFAGYVVLAVFAVIYLGPFVLSVATSFKTRPGFAADPTSLFPDPVTTEWWRRSLGVIPDPSANFILAAGNSVLVSVVATVGRVLLDSLAGYALARLRFPGRRVVFAGVLATLAVPPIVLLIPRFLVVKQLGIYSTYAALVLPLLADAVGIFIMKQFFEQVPREMEEAARIDGAGVLRTWWSVVLPLVRPGLITLTILSFQATWNEFQIPLVVNNDPSKFTLPIALALQRGSSGQDFNFPLFLAGAVLATIPVAIVFLVFQRYFVRGQLEGAVKG